MFYPISIQTQQMCVRNAPCFKMLAIVEEGDLWRVGAINVIEARCSVLGWMPACLLEYIYRFQLDQTSFPQKTVMLWHFSPWLRDCNRLAALNKWTTITTLSLNAKCRPEHNSFFLVSDRLLSLSIIRSSPFFCICLLFFFYWRVWGSAGQRLQLPS